MIDRISNRICDEISSVAKAFNAAAHLSESDSEFRYPLSSPDVIHDLLSGLLSVPCDQQRLFVEKALELAIHMRFGID